MNADARYDGSETVLLDRPSSGPFLWNGLDEVPAGWGPCVVTLGVFDGVHKGHSTVIGHAVRAGRARGLPTVLVTFDPHPARVVGIDRDTATLTTVERRAELVHELGVDAVLVLPFTPELARVTADSFVDRVLVRTLEAREVVVGSNFTFGHKGSGTVDTLRELGRNHGFRAHGVNLTSVRDHPNSSTHVRTCLRSGDVRAATHALGRPHRIDAYCDTTGYLRLPAGTAIPAAGLYVARTGTDTVHVRVSPDGAILLLPPSPGAVNLEFLERRRE
ncbi:cytidyltransferase [Allosaccharopolyspora coralli]|uniref:FAD synthase n=1 Tax=Allosaccharopolyspora coralli TaxID=2665642 RepID=A0A5Q3QCA5_9PSEU|nr:cytidyltransferase [Allosaccharopolyspora coralli]QGK70996.1 cytidyltransferase [Allosaccharopolyspora coralli]